MLFALLARARVYVVYIRIYTALNASNSKRRNVLFVLNNLEIQKKYVVFFLFLLLFYVGFFLFLIRGIMEDYVYSVFSVCIMFLVVHKNYVHCQTRRLYRLHQQKQHACMQNFHKWR
jgi:hypothetical protein